MNHENPFTRQISEGGVSIVSSSDSLSIADAPRSSSTANNMDRPLPLKKRALASVNTQSLADDALSPSKVSLLSSPIDEY